MPMADKLNYTSKSLLEVEFTKNVRGYDPLQVDQTLDKVIEDLSHYERFKEETIPYIQTLERNIYDLKEKIKDNEVEIAKLNNRLSNIKDDTNVSKENMALLKRITTLENALYKLGKDPSKL